jgi:hypothetical protein
MSPKRFAPLLLCLALFSSCTVLKVGASDSGFESDAFISGHLTAGWPDDLAILDLKILDGYNDGSIFWFNVWNLVRVEVGLIGASVGVGPLDFGLGILFYEAYPPSYGTEWFGVSGGVGSGDDDHDHDDHDHDHD